MPKIEYSKGVYRSTKQQLRKEIIGAVKVSPSIRKEISRVFQVANRRIQNIERAGLWSPAVMDLGKDDIQGYTKFSMRNDWDTLRREYVKAVNFLRQPTSSASGARQYDRKIMDEYDLTDEEFRLVTDKLRGKYLTMEQNNYVERVLLQYKDFTGDLEAEAESVHGQMESDAEALEKAMDATVEKMVDDADKELDEQAERLTNMADEEIKKMLEDFERFD